MGTDYRRPMSLPREPLSWVQSATAVFVGTLLALALFAVGVRLYVKWSIESGVDEMKQKMEQNREQNKPTPRK